MFKGISNLTIDDKGRISMPQRYRDDFGQKKRSKIIITADKEECLLVYTSAAWSILEKQLIELPSYNFQARFIQRLVLGHATESDIDAQGRFLIPGPLRDYAKLDRKVVLIGQGKKFEMWSEELWNKKFKSWLKSESNKEFNDDGISNIKL